MQWKFLASLEGSSRQLCAAMDLITGLPTTSEGHDTILVIVYRTSNLIHCAPTRKTITGPGLADLVINNVFRYHGLPRNIISDRDPRTTSNFWRALCSTLGTKLRVSTSFHPQTDGQTERANRTLEEMLRAFVRCTTASVSFILLWLGWLGCCLTGLLYAELLQDTGDCGQGSLEHPDLGLHGDWVHRE